MKYELKIRFKIIKCFMFVRCMFGLIDWKSPGKSEHAGISHWDNSAASLTRSANEPGSCPKWYRISLCSLPSFCLIKGERERNRSGCQLCWRASEDKKKNGLVKMLGRYFKTGRKFSSIKLKVERRLQCVDWHWAGVKLHAVIFLYYVLQYYHIWLSYSIFKAVMTHRQVTAGGWRRVISSSGHTALLP